MNGDTSANRDARLTELGALRGVMALASSAACSLASSSLALTVAETSRSAIICSTSAGSIPASINCCLTDMTVSSDVDSWVGGTLVCQAVPTTHIAYALSAWRALVLRDRCSVSVVVVPLSLPLPPISPGGGLLLSCSGVAWVTCPVANDVQPVRQSAT